jgi:hypothetical protein
MHRHREERSDVAIQGMKDSGGGPWIASSLSLLAMTSAAVRQERRP